MGLLRSVRMRLRTVHFEARELNVAHLIRRQHAADGALDQPFGIAFANVLRGLRAQTTGISAMAAVKFLRPLLAAELNFLGVENNDEVAVVDVRSPGRFVLAGDGPCNTNRERAQTLARGINDIPSVLRIGGLHLERLHNRRIVSENGG